MDCNSKYFKAMAFHSFVKDSVPQYSNCEFQTKKNTSNYRRLYSDNTDYTSIFLWVITLTILFINIFNGFEKTPLVTLLAACITWVIALHTIKNQKKLKQIELSIAAIEGAFTDPFPYKLKGGELNEQHVNLQYERPILKAVAQLANFLKGDAFSLEKAETMILLAFSSEPKIWDQIDQDKIKGNLINDIKESDLTKLLNNLEKICQGISYNVYSEELIKDYMGSDLQSCMSYLLVYIYARRELHAIRVNERDDMLAQMMDHPNKYQTHTEFQDFLYEYLEYFCYKWHWTNEKPVSFDYFHLRISTIYKLFAEYLKGFNLQKNSADIYQINLPLLSIIKHYLK